MSTKNLTEQIEKSQQQIVSQLQGDSYENLMNQGYTQFETAGQTAAAQGQSYSFVQASTPQYITTQTGQVGQVIKENVYYQNAPGTQGPYMQYSTSAQPVVQGQQFIVQGQTQKVSPVRVSQTLPTAQPVSYQSVQYMPSTKYVQPVTTQSYIVQQQPQQTKIVERQILVGASHEECDARYVSLQRLLAREQQEKGVAIQSFEQCKYKCEMAEVQVKSLQIRTKEQDEYIQQLLQQNEILRQDADQVRTQFQSVNRKISEYESIRIEYEQRIKLLEQSNHQLHSTLSVITTESDTMKKQHLLLEEQILAGRRWEQGYNEINEYYARKCSEYDTLKKEFEELSSRLTVISQFESRISMLSQQNDGLYRQLEEKMKEIDAWRVKYSKIEIEFNETRTQSMLAQELRAQLQLVVNENQKIQQAFLSKKSECDELRENVARYQLFNNEKTNEINKLKELMGVLQVDLQRRDKEYSELSLKYGQIERYQIELRQKEQTNQELEQRLSLLVKEFERQAQVFAEKDRAQFSQIHQLQEELRKIINQGTISQSQIIDWKQKYESLIAINVNLKKQSDMSYEYKSQIEKLVEENQRFDYHKEQTSNAQASLHVTHQKCKQFEDTLSEREMLIVRLNNDVSMLKSQIESYQKEIYSWQNKYSNYEGVLNENGQLRIQIGEFDSKIQLLVMQLEARNKAFTSKEEELRQQILLINSLRTQYQQMEQSYKSTENERNSFRLQFDSKQSQLQKYELQCREMETIIISLRNELSKKSESDGRVLLLSQELERLSVALKQYQEYTVKLESEKSSYEKYLLEVNSLKQEKAQWQAERDSLRLTITSMQTQISEYSSYSYKNKEYEQKVLSLQQENQQLAVLLNARVDEISRLKIEVSSLQQYRFQSDNIQGEVDRLASYVLSLNGVIQDHLLRFVVCFAEIDSLRQQVQERDLELNTLRKYSEHQSYLVQRNIGTAALQGQNTSAQLVRQSMANLGSSTSLLSQSQQVPYKSIQQIQAEVKAEMQSQQEGRGKSQTVQAFISKGGSGQSQQIQYQNIEGAKQSSSFVEKNSYQEPTLRQSKVTTTTTTTQNAGNPFY